MTLTNGARWSGPELDRDTLRRDKHHAWALEIAGKITEPLLTCEAVLAEAAFHLDSAAIVVMRRDYAQNAPPTIHKSDDWMLIDYSNSWTSKTPILRTTRGNW